MLRYLMTLGSLASMILAINLGCQSESTPTETSSKDLAQTAPESSLPDTRDANPYDRALLVSLAKHEPLNTDGLHNVFRLSEQIVSGSEPQGEAAFAKIRDMGVKTILSVDGKAPEIEVAERFGLRYVHIPIEYSGISEVEFLKISKSFRELEGPFYVHCFHGKHRGPAAAAIGRVVLDEVPRNQALAEMRQWCGTSQKYGGLYFAIAEADMPTAEDTKDFAFDFPNRQTFEGIRAIMIPAPRAHDKLKDLKKRGWEIDPEHPDVSPLNEAQKVHDLYLAMANLPDADAEDEDFRGWVADGLKASEELVVATRALHLNGASAKTLKLADEALAGVSASCAACHTVYRN